jgi:hypothetical protein
MAMKPSSKFERMNAAKLGKAPAKSGAASMPRIGTTGGAASDNAIRDRRQSASRASGAVLPKIAYMKAPAEDAGEVRQVLPAKLRPMADPKIKARREAMRKATQKMGPMK